MTNTSQFSGQSAAAFEKSILAKGDLMRFDAERETKIQTRARIGGRARLEVCDSFELAEDAKVM